MRQWKQFLHFKLKKNFLKEAYPAYVRWYKDSGSRLAASTIIASSKFFRILTLAFFTLDYNRNCEISVCYSGVQSVLGLEWHLYKIFSVWNTHTFHSTPSQMRCLKAMILRLKRKCRREAQYWHTWHVHP